MHGSDINFPRQSATLSNLKRPPASRALSNASTCNKLPNSTFFYPHSFTRNWSIRFCFPFICKVNIFTSINLGFYKNFVEFVEEIVAAYRIKKKLFLYILAVVLFSDPNSKIKNRLRSSYCLEYNFIGNLRSIARNYLNRTAMITIYWSIINIYKRNRIVMRIGDSTPPSVSVNHSLFILCITYWTSISNNILIMIINKVLDGVCGSPTSTRPASWTNT